METVWDMGLTALETAEAVEVSSLPLHDIVRHILYQRGVATPEAVERFLKGTLVDEYDPFILKGMKEAVERIEQARRQGERILVHGDYDVDGVTAAALLGKTFDELGLPYYLYLPERLKGGYGVSKKAIYYAREQGAKLIVTVDCGISAFEEVDLARSFGIDVIVTDHHRPSTDALPPAYVIVNPWQPGCPYPFKELSGVGIAYKLSRALGTKPGDKYLDLVAFGTVCDLSTLVDENRLLVKYGLKKIEEGGNCGIAALRKVAGIKTKKTNTGHLGFMLGPRINASGRLGSAECALRLLVTDNPAEAESLANALDAENKERQKLESVILREAVTKVENEVNFNRDRIIVVWNTNWHLGVIGIVAQRLVEQYNLPAIVIAVDREAGVCRGSVRSVRGFNIFEALSSMSDLFLEYGGHEYAAGIEIPVKNLETLRARINAYAHEKTGGAPFVRTFVVDAELLLHEITKELVTSLEMLEPYGRGNPKPLFYTRNLICKERSIFLNKNTAKLWVTDGEYTYEVLWYKAPVDTKIAKGDRVDIIYNLTQRRWYDRESIVLEVKDLRKL